MSSCATYLQHSWLQPLQGIWTKSEGKVYPAAGGRDEDLSWERLIGTTQLEVEWMEKPMLGNEKEEVS